jgi:hypothetical protein
MTGPPSPDPAIRRRNRRLTNADAEHYANAYGDPDRLRSAFEVYRALAADITLSTKNTATGRLSKVVDTAHSVGAGLAGRGKIRPRVLARRARTGSVRRRLPRATR